MRNDHCHAKIHRQVNENLKAYRGVQMEKLERDTSPRQHSVHAHGVYFLMGLKMRYGLQWYASTSRHPGFHKGFQINFDLKIKCPLLMEVSHSSHLPVFATVLCRKKPEYNTTCWRTNLPHSYSDTMAGWALREAGTMQKFLLWNLQRNSRTPFSSYKTALNLLGECKA